MKKLPNPIPFAGCYSLDLYCDTVNPDHCHFDFPHQFTGETFGECARDARASGWVIHRGTNTATCPDCSGKK